MASYFADLNILVVVCACEWVTSSQKRRGSRKSYPIHPQFHEGYLQII